LRYTSSRTRSTVLTELNKETLDQVAQNYFCSVLEVVNEFGSSNQVGSNPLNQTTL